ncbi:MAG: T9SS type A sorting domain-containing protein [Mariniphaga sp.]|nr:T9SS type A sorting domain-containing protein [Mariniphaga sp.]
MNDFVNYASGNINKKFTGPPEKSKLKSAGSVKTVFKVNSENLTEEAKLALNYAVYIWEDLFYSPVPVNLLVKMESMDANVLAKSRPTSFYMNFEETLYKNVYYPVALAEKLSGEDMNSGNYDIICCFNLNVPWYFGTDGNTPETHYDFLTAVLHEIAHGFGFSGFYKDDGSNGFLNNGNNVPSIYDFFVYNSSNQQLANSDIFASPSVQLHNALVSGDLRFLAPNENEKYARISEVYSPPYWNDGASIYHLTDNEGLMTPFATKGSAVHHPGNEVLTILNKIGWSAPVFNFEPLKDFEEPCAELPVEIEIYSGDETNNFEVQIILSTNNFETSKSSELNLTESPGKFKGLIPLEYSTGKIDYYFEAKTKNGEIYTFPTSAPNKKLSFKIGPDYIPPVIAHNPQKIIPENSGEFIINALAKDNLGINSVKVEYKLNGVLYSPIELKLSGKENYSGILQLNNEQFRNGNLEYRIVAEDKSVIGNKKYQPSAGFYSVSFFQSLEPVNSYFSDFETGSSDFVVADFNISRMVGFSDNILHTVHPYPLSAVKDEKFNLIAQLKYPVILQVGGEMHFDEVVLVEPGEKGTDFSEDLFWDFVIVEGSKDNGFTWIPFSPGYDSGSNENWESAFLNSTVNNKSQAVGNQNMFLKNVIYLTDDTGFSEGDTVLFRFRLTSDHSLNGWGWAIDNLEIQTRLATDSDLIAQKSIHVYPNPFDNKFFVDFSTIENSDRIEVSVTDIFGKTIYKKEGTVSSVGPELIELSGVKSGIYLLKVTDGKKVLFAKKMIKK